MSAFVVRSFERADKAAVTQLWQQELPSSSFWNDPEWIVERKLGTQGELFWVGEVDGKVVATVLAGFDGVRGWIYSMAVDRKVQRRGYGQQIMRHALECLNSLGCDKVNLQVRADNLAVVKFYESLGFELEERASMGKVLVADDIDPADDHILDMGGDFTLTRNRLSDLQKYVEHFNHSERFHRYLITIPFPYTEMDARSWLRRQTTGPRFGPFQNWAIRDGSGDLIGGVGLKSLVRGAQAEIGYWLSEPRWGQGIMPRAVVALCDYAFEHYALKRIEALVVVGNHNSCRVLEKSGFQQEGVLRNRLPSHQGLADATIWSKLPKE